MLIAESLEPVTFTNSKNCTVLGGRWYDPYTNTYFTVAGELDVDHFVPLGNAHSSGGADWGADRKRDFANSLNDADHLIAVSASANRSKEAAPRTNGSRPIKAIGASMPMIGFALRVRGDFLPPKANGLRCKA